MLANVSRSPASRPATRAPQQPPAPGPGTEASGGFDDVPGDRIDGAATDAERRLERLADAIARRTQYRLLQQKAGADARQAELDRLQQAFDFEQKERAELLREFNLMRDLALEQVKRDDEAVKKWMALV